MSQYAKELKFYEQFEEMMKANNLKRSDVEIEGNDATLYDEWGKHFFELRETEWVFVGDKQW
ncbi:hypothetical protein ACSU6B_23440 [Neobacillus sp. C211]|uniref:hypothetical protein n=1 Tax=unclassified Neobacillus TaxID=2675272 RepID=UPI003978D0D2